jgi:hypothetical protein
LLEILSAFVPDQFINTLLATRPQPGPRPFFCAAQLWRIHLLALLTPAHSFNAVVRLLPEQRAWRHFARLPHRQRTLDAVLYVVKCGCPWRYLPTDFPAWQTVYHVFR